MQILKNVLMASWVELLIFITTIMGALYFFKDQVGKLADRIDKLDNKISDEIVKLEQKLSTQIEKFDQKLSSEILAVKSDLEKTNVKLDKKVDHLDQKIDSISHHLDKKLDTKCDKLEADIAAVRKDVNRNTSHLSNIEGQITQLTRPNIIRIEREDIERKPLSDTAEKLKDMAN